MFPSVAEAVRAMADAPVAVYLFRYVAGAFLYENYTSIKLSPMAGKMNRLEAHTYPFGVPPPWLPGDCAAGKNMSKHRVQYALLMIICSCHVVVLRPRARGKGAI